MELRPEPETPQALTPDRVRAVRRQINAYLAEQMRELGFDPARFLQEAADMGAVEFFGRWLEPEVPPPPPLVVLFGMEWLELGPSRARLALEPADWMLNPYGSIHGGIAATLLDTVLGAAIQTTLPAGTGYATSDLHVRYVRAMTPGAGRVIATGEVLHAGRRHATAEGRVEVESTGKLAATATTACTIFRPSEE